MEDYACMYCVGEGTFGSVTKARHRASGQLVALKRIRLRDIKHGAPNTALRELIASTDRGLRSNSRAPPLTPLLLTLWLAAAPAR